MEADERYFQRLNDLIALAAELGFREDQAMLLMVKSARKAGGTYPRALADHMAPMAEAQMVRLRAELAGREGGEG